MIRATRPPLVAAIATLPRQNHSMTYSPQIVPTLKTGQEPFTTAGVPAPLSLQGFWAWQGSDLLSNAQRGVLAEYLVAQAVGDPSPVREEWATWDVETPDGLHIEVKSSAYVQSWHQTSPSRIEFDVKPTTALTKETGKYQGPAKRHADVYVFCLLAEQDPALVDPMNLDQWQFFVIPTRVLDAHSPTQQKMGLASVKRLAGTHVSWSGLDQRVGEALSR